LPFARGVAGGNRLLALRAECRANPISHSVRTAGRPEELRRLLEQVTEKVRLPNLLRRQLLSQYQQLMG